MSDDETEDLEYLPPLPRPKSRVSPKDEPHIVMKLNVHRSYPGKGYTYVEYSDGMAYSTRTGRRWRMPESELRDRRMRNLLDLTADRSDD